MAMAIGLRRVNLAGWRRPLPLQAELSLSYLFIILISLGGLVIWSATRSQHEIIEAKEHDLEIQAHLLSIMLHDQIEGALQGYLSTDELAEQVRQHLTGEDDMRITIMDDDLFILASTDSRVAQGLEDHHIELIAASQGKEQHDIRVDDVSGEERIFTAAPVMDRNRRPITYIQVSAASAPTWQRIHSTWAGLGGVMLIAVMAVAVSGVVVSRRTVRPLRALTAAAQQLMRGDRQHTAVGSGPLEVIQLVDAFNQMARRLEDAISRQQQFVANAAHELRSPLAAIRLRLELLQNPSAISREEASHMLEELLRDIDHLRRTIDNLLALSALDEGQRVQLGPLDLAPLLYEVADQIMPMMGAAGLAFDVDVPPHLPVVLASAEQVRMILWNLLDNARKYTPAGRQVRLAAHADSTHVRVQVQDTGPGIPPDVMAHLFERFRRGMRDRNRRAGTGLGLALVSELARANDIAVEVDSSPERGTAFTLSFPLAPAVAGAKPAKTHAQRYQRIA